MECAVITTYRCNARCGMCNSWANPSRASEEFKPEILEKLPGGMHRLNITGGEPLLREDILEIVRILDRKTTRLEISTNGYFVDRAIVIAEQFPRITVRVSVEGLPELNDSLRGLNGGFDRAMRTVLRLKRLGIEDIGFAMTISGDNCRDLLDLYTLAAAMDLELANAVVHNSFYFHKHDNEIRNRAEVETAMMNFIRHLLDSRRTNVKKRVKDWFRAYLNMGLLRHIQGRPRLMPCGAGTDTFFLDPWGRILACNGSAQPMLMGDLNTGSFEEIWHSPQAAAVRKQVSECERDCWMTGTAVPAMRGNPWAPLRWVVRNKVRLALGKPLLL